MKEICPEILIISDKYDYSTDHVVYHLRKMGASYLRLNRDQFPEYEINLSPTDQKIFGKTRKFKFHVKSDLLKSIYFRAPIYLRDNYQPNLSLDEQLRRGQWASFIRSLIIFENVLWVNNPQATYKSEIKPYQLFLAKNIGFNVPETLITNSINKPHLIANKQDKVIIKSLDPAILNINNKEAFVYTNIVDYPELLEAHTSDSPLILQELLLPKIDIRVTVVGDVAFAVAILKNDEGLDKDWRLEKDNVQYSKFKLPKEIEKKCIEIVKKLNLNFGGIDLILNDKNYYFIEINPTGEWSWLMDHTKLPIDKEIAKLLINGTDCNVK